MSNADALLTDRLPLVDHAAAPPATRDQWRLTAKAFASAAVGMFAYEAAKSALLPKLSLWQSHTITIAVGAVTASIVAHLAVRRQAAADRALAAARVRQAALAESESRYRLLVEASPEAIAVHRDGRLLYVNAAGATLLGASDPSTLAGRSAFELVHPDDRAQIVARRADPDGRPVAYRLVRADGQIVDIEAASVPITFQGRPAIQTVCRDVSERKRLEAQLVHLAFHDALTGLANRALFRDRAAHALARVARSGAAAPMAVLFLDLDDFKSVNDGLGHAAGDELLQVVAERIRLATRGHDTVARLGGDEFSVLLEDLHHEDDARIAADRIASALRRPIALDGRDVVVTASIGVAIARPGEDVDAVLRNADVAMYAAKAAGKGRHTVYETAMYTAVVDRLELAADLRAAAVDPARHGFELVYQPVVELDTGAIHGAEALLRWHHPRRGPVSPSVSIPIAEETGIIVPLGRWVLTTACAQLADWLATCDADRPLTTLPSVGVNVSSRQLEAPGFVADVATALRTTGVPPSCLTLEITESVLMQRTEATLDTLRELKALGVRLAIDDFGTGYSSLAYLQRFPIDVLKIDRSFVDGVARGGSDAALARTIIALGDLLEVRTVAEGIEDAAQRDQLRALGCDLGQGYLFARPTTAHEVGAMLRGGVSAATRTGALAGVSA